MVDTASDKKANDIVLLNVGELTTIADFFIICSGTSDRQVQAIAQAILEAGEQEGRRPIGVEGLSAARWVLVDFGDVIAHVFTPDERDYYRLERLWGDAPVVVRVQ
ncbi:MAG: ribosome silencing factor [Chloroflexi bacterium]|nr:MAG: ribosome silencing factor [Chloroflexota bacterium]